MAAGLGSDRRKERKEDGMIFVLQSRRELTDEEVGMRD